MSDNKLIITMWETYGCGMEQIAGQVAQQLGLQVHKQAFTSAQIEQAEAERANEGGFMRFVRRVGSMHVGDAVSDGAARAEQESWTQLALENTQLVREEAAAGGVILGRNGAFILNDEPRSLHVKLDGLPTERAKQAAQLKGISLEQAVLQLEERMIRQTLEKCRWHRGKAAEELGLNLRTLQRKMRRMSGGSEKLQG